jgi:hypothetical protein
MPSLKKKKFGLGSELKLYSDRAGCVFSVQNNLVPSASSSGLRQAHGAMRLEALSSKLASLLGITYSQ